MQVHPLVARGREAFLRRAVAMQVVVADDRHGRIDQAVVGDGALEQVVRRAFQAEGVRLEERLVRRERPRDPDRLDRALDREARVVDGVVTHGAKDLARALLAVGALHRRLVLRHR